MQAAKRVAINTGFLYARMAITVFISLYSTRLILNALGAEDFGLFNVVGGAIVMLTFLNNAMAGATQRFMSFAQGEGNFEKQRYIFNVSVVLHFFIAILVILLLEVAGYFLFNGILKIPVERMDVARLIFQFMLISTFFTIVSVPYDAVINAHENMFVVAILGVFEAIIKLAIAIYITHTKFDKLISYGFLMATLSILLLIIRRIYCNKKYSEVRINFKKYYNKPLLKEMTSFAGWSFLGSTSSMIANYGQGIVINMFFGTVVNAAQGISGQVSGQLGAFATTMLKALNPLIVKSEGAGNREMMLKASIMGSKISFFLLMFFYIPIILEMPYIFNLWLNNVPEFTIIFCRLLLLRNLIEQLFIPLSASIAAVGDIRKFQIYSSILNFSPLIISYILFSFNYPAYSLYIVFIFYSLFNSILTLLFAKRTCNLSIPFFIKTIVIRCIVSIYIVTSIAILPHYLLPEGMLRFTIVAMVSLFFFLPVIWVTGLTKAEQDHFKIMLNIIIRRF